jgi:hypothetical protein
MREDTFPISIKAFDAFSTTCLIWLFRREINVPKRDELLDIEKWE